MVQFFILRSKVQQEYNGLLVNALNRIFNSNLSLNNFKWMLTKVELSCVRNIIPRSKKRLGNGYPVLSQELQNHNPFLRHIPVKVMHGCTPPPPPGPFRTCLCDREKRCFELLWKSYNTADLLETYWAVLSSAVAQFIYYAVIRGSSYCILVWKKALRGTNYLKGNGHYLSISLFISRYKIGDRF